MNSQSGLFKWKVFIVASLYNFYIKTENIKKQPRLSSAVLVHDYNFGTQPITNVGHGEWKHLCLHECELNTLNHNSISFCTSMKFLLQTPAQVSPQKKLNKIFSNSSLNTSQCNLAITRWRQQFSNPCLGEAITLRSCLFCPDLWVNLRQIQFSCVGGWFVCHLWGCLRFLFFKIVTRPDAGMAGAMTATARTLQNPFIFYGSRSSVNWGGEQTFGVSLLMCS